MRIVAILMLLVLLPACSRDPDVSESAKLCEVPYDTKALDQCVAACIKCEKGITTTCTTACKLRGAR